MYFGSSTYCVVPMVIAVRVKDWESDHYKMNWFPSSWSSHPVEFRTALNLLVVCCEAEYNQLLMKGTSHRMMGPW
jgi:hypothetical protein